MNPLQFSWQLTRRDWRAGELRLLLAALVVAVAALASVGVFVDRMRAALSVEARQLLGADLVLAADQPVAAEFRDEARRRGLEVAETVNFPSMVVADGRPQLAAIKAVSDNYPLRGRLRAAERVNGPDAGVTGTPAPGTVWGDAQLLLTLGVATGATVELGESRLTVARVITLEPDRGASFVNFAPRAMIRLDALESTRLIQPASRVTYRLLLAGDPQAVAAYEAWAKPRLGRGLRIESLESGRPELRVTLDRAEQFLSLVALLSALIAAVAIGLAARRFAERHLDGCAVMRAIGIRQKRLLLVLGLELLWVGLLGGLAGVAVGALVHLALVQMIAPLIQLPLPPPSVWPVLRSVAAGLILLLGFGAWPFLRLAGVPPLRVLRREPDGARASPWIALVLAVAAFVALLFWFSSDRRLAGIAIGGFAGGALVSVLVAWAALRLVAPLRRAGARFTRSPALRLALASWSRRQGAAIAQTVALAIGLMALMLLTVTRTDLLDSWRRASPADAPNRFVINIQPDQRAAVDALLREAGVSSELSPMIRGRLVTVNGAAIGPEQFSDARAQRLVDREFNLSYAQSVPAHNTLVAGRWFAAGAKEVSVEAGILDTLGLKLGDRLGFDVAGDTVEVVATSVRKLDWDSMKVNFFMILSPAALGAAPQTLITAYHQRADRPPLDAELVRRFPNLTVFDTGNIVRQVQTILEQVVRAVQFLFVLTLAAGIVVLYTALASSRDDRVREAGLMRALGASRAQLQRAQLWELGLSGGLAGLLAALGASTVGWVLARQVFRFELAWRADILVWGIIAGAALAIVAGWFGLRGVLASPPLATLRNA